MALKHPDSTHEENSNITPEKTEAVAESAADDKILFWCSECGQKYRLPKDSAGETGICFKCQGYLFIPTKSQKKPPSIKNVFFPCIHCGSKQRKARKFIGEEVKCSECGEKNTVPEKSRRSALSKKGKKPEERILFWCHYCGQKYRLPKHLAGKSGSCDRCFNDFIIPNKTQDKPSVKETIVFPCDRCGHKLWKPVEEIGKEISCGKCTAKNIVPKESSTSSLTKPEIEAKARILFWCRHCGQKYRLPLDMAGKGANCDKCHNDFIIPTESQNKPERREAIFFPCEHCGKRIQKLKELAGTKIDCAECGRENTVPEKSRKSLFELFSSRKYDKPIVSPEATRMNLRLPQQMTKPSISPEKEAPEEINLPKKKSSPKPAPEPEEYPEEELPEEELAQEDYFDEEATAAHSILEEFPTEEEHPEEEYPEEPPEEPPARPSSKRTQRSIKLNLDTISRPGEKPIQIRPKAEKAPEKRSAGPSPEKTQRNIKLNLDTISRPGEKPIQIHAKTKEAPKKGTADLNPDKTQRSIKLSPESISAPGKKAKRSQAVPPAEKTQRGIKPSSDAISTSKDGQAEPPAKKTKSKIKMKPKEAPKMTRYPTRTFLKSEEDEFQDGAELQDGAVPQENPNAPIRIFPETEQNIIFWCGYCKQKYRLPHSLSGKKSFCDNCKNNLFIPSVSQTKPQIKDTIAFSCKSCEKQLWKPKELAGTEIICHECGEDNIVPEKSEKSLLQKITPMKLHNKFITDEPTKTNMIVVGQPTIDPDAPLDEQLAAKASLSEQTTKTLPSEQIVAKPKKKKFKVVYNTDPVKEKEQEKKRVLPTREDYIGPQIVITEDPPAIQKVKKYFQLKAEKFFVFAVVVLLIDYLINTYGEGKRPSKTFVLFCTFTVAAIILLTAWNFISYRPPGKTNKCRYNVTCLKDSCKLNKIRRFENITKGKCSKCSSNVGLAYRCKSCNTSFVYDEVKSKKEHKAKLAKEDKRKKKWFGKKAKTNNNLFSNRVIKRCPNCRSENVYYVTVKQAEKEAEQLAKDKEFRKAAKKKKAKKKK